MTLRITPGGSGVFGGRQVQPETITYDPAKGCACVQHDPVPESIVTTAKGDVGQVGITFAMCTLCGRNLGWFRDSDQIVHKY